MSTITQRFVITAARDYQREFTGVQQPLGRAVKWDDKDIVLELDVVPVGKWWSSVISVTPEGVVSGVSPIRRGRLAARRKP